MRVAIVHNWFLNTGGAERVTELLAAMFPQAHVFTLFADPKSVPAGIQDRLTTSFLDKIKGARNYSRSFFPLYPGAIEHFDMRGYDLIISSDSLGLYGVATRPDQLNVCYCHTPPRYVFNAYEAFRATLPWAARPAFSVAARYYRNWSYEAAQRVDEFIANSRYVSERISTYFHRESTLIYPPVNTSWGYIDRNVEDYYLYVGRFTEHKRVDILVEACNRLGRRLLVGGTGRTEKFLKSVAGPKVEFLGRVPDAELPGLFAKARAFLFASDEDFGLAPLEAQSCGRPVVAWGHGGLLETVVPYGSSPHPTGIHFKKQTVDSACEGILRFESLEHVFDPVAVRAHAQRFDTSVFITRMQEFIRSKLDERGEGVTFAPISTQIAN
jgi:glycosyltransferase involved in cell wall biosynthesis